jgi:hypothetical protein
MNEIKEKLQGKKTYFAVAIGLLYLVGVWAGFWEFREDVLAAVGLGGLAFLRSALGKSEGQSEGQSGGRLLGVMGVMGVMLCGCGTLDPAGAYKGDKVLYDADTTIASSYEVINSFLLWEHNNRVALGSMPEVTAYADTLRKQSPRWFNSAIVLRDTYANVPNDGTRDALTSAIAVLRQAMGEASRHLAARAAPGLGLTQ